MKKGLFYLIGALIVSSMFIGCGQKSADNNTNTTETTSEKNTEVSTVEEENAVQVLNANLATEEDLKKAGVSPAVIKTILEERPFLSLSILTEKIKEEGTEELFKKVFVPLNLNTTTEADFKVIPGVGDRMAHEFVEYRPYKSIKQFRKEIGKYVDEAEVARYENYVFVPVDLNSATEEDIKALPGVGDRMAHEFEEYRPYENLKQFRKEIGKYVDDKELDRLERFVFIEK